eukprot:gene41796-60363_t
MSATADALAAPFLPPAAISPTRGRPAVGMPVPPLRLEGGPCLDPPSASRTDTLHSQSSPTRSPAHHNLRPPRSPRSPAVGGAVLTKAQARTKTRREGKMAQVARKLLSRVDVGRERNIARLQRGDRGAAAMVLQAMCRKFVIAERRRAATCRKFVGRLRNARGRRLGPRAALLQAVGRARLSALRVAHVRWCTRMAAGAVAAQRMWRGGAGRRRFASLHLQREERHMLLRRAVAARAGAANAERAARA